MQTMSAVQSGLRVSPAATYRPEAISILDDRRLRDMAQSYATRRVPRNKIATLLGEELEPEVGDLILVRVARVGRYDYIEASDSTISRFRPGQELVLCYARPSDGSETIGILPSAARRFQLLSPAGIAARVQSRVYSDGLVTELEYIGVLADTRGNRINLEDWAIPSGGGSYVSQPVIAVIGEPMLPGEPCRSADIIRGLSQSGFRVGAANITGVPGCWKLGLLRNAGAKLAVDITDAGYIGISGLAPETIEKIFLSLSGHLAESGVDVLVLEIEQGVFGHDTANIVSLPCLQNRISNIVLEGRIGREAELERDTLRALGYNVTLVDAPEGRSEYMPLI